MIYVASHKFDHEYIITFNYWIDAVLIMLIRHEYITIKLEQLESKKKN